MLPIYQVTGLTISVVPTCRDQRNHLYSAIRALERHLAAKFAEWNAANLRSYCLRLLCAMTPAGPEPAPPGSAAAPVCLQSGRSALTADRTAATLAPARQQVVGVRLSVNLVPAMRPVSVELHLLPAAPRLGEASAVAMAAACFVAADPLARSAAGPFPWPYYLISTRDSFTYGLVQRSEQVRTHRFPRESAESMDLLLKHVAWLITAGGGPSAPLHKDVVFLQGRADTARLLSGELASSSCAAHNEPLIDVSSAVSLRLPDCFHSLARCLGPGRPT